MTFKAAVLRELNKPLRIETLETPQELGVGQALVRVKRSGICGAQLGEIAGVKGQDKYLPHLMGHEGAGVVEAIGPGVKHVVVGDRVVMHWRKGVGIEADCPKYKVFGDSYSIVGGGWATTFNEMAVVSENRLTAVAEHVPFDVMALMGCALTTALGVINNDAQVKFGQSIAVIGCGGVGLNVIQAAAMASAHPIFGVDLYEHKLEVAKKFGATFVMKDLKSIRDMLPKGCDVVIDTTGRAEMIEAAYELTANGGKTVLVAQMRHDHKARIQTLPMHTGKAFFASEGGQTDPSVHIPRYLRLFDAGKLNVDGLVTHRYKLDEINVALDEIRAGRTGRVMIEMD